MRVLSVGNIYPPHDFGGGYELTWRSSVLQLRTTGHQVRVLATDYRAPEVDVAAELDPDVHRDLRWYWHDHAFPRRGVRERIALERHNHGALDHHLREFAPEVVSWWGLGGMSLSLVEHVRRAGLPAVGIVGDEWMVWGPRADAWVRLFRRRPRLGALAERVTGLPARPDLSSAATWLFNSEHVKRQVENAAGSLRSAGVLHPGIDAELFRPAPERPWTWRLLYLGRLDERKGVMTLIQALPLLPEDTRLVLQGSGDQAYVESLRTRSAELGVASRVTFTREPRERLPEVYAGADALVFPVVWEEPWGLVPLEAMAVGRPVVTTATGGSAEYLQNGTNCLTFEPRDSGRALAAALRQMAEDAALRARIRQAGFATAARFTEDRYNAGIESALLAALAAGSRHD